VVTFGDAVRLRVEALDGQGNPVDRVYVTWSVADPRMTINSAGLLTAPSTRLTTSVTAQMPTGIQGSGSVTVVPPLEALEKVSEDDQDVLVGSPVPLMVRVLGADGLGVPRWPVTFSATSGGGSVDPATVFTDSEGRAASVGVVGTGPGPQTFQAQVENLSPVTFSFMAVPLPAIGLEPHAVELVAAQGSGQPSADQVQVTNLGGGTLDGLSVTVEYLQGSTGWLTAALEGDQAPTTLFLTGSPEDLLPGIYGARAWVASTVASNSPQAVDIVLEVVAPVPHIQATPSLASWMVQETSAGIPPRGVQITNSGGGTLTGLSVTVQPGEGQPAWLGAVLSSSTAPATLTLSPVAGLPPGVYTADVLVTAPGADNSPLNVPATMTVTAVPPRIQLSQSSAHWDVDAGTPTPTQIQFSVTNAGGGTLSDLQVSVLYDPDSPHWLSAVVIPTTAPATVSLSPTPYPPAGTYAATVVISSNVAENSPVTIPASMVAFNRPVVSNPGFNLLGLNDSKNCSAQSPPGSYFRFYLDYYDADGDIPVISGEVSQLYGEPILMQYQFLPSGNAGSVKSNGDVDGDNFGGTALFESCIQFGPAQNTSVFINLSMFDLGGHESNRVSLTINRPLGANSPPAGVAGSIGGSGR